MQIHRNHVLGALAVLVTLTAAAPAHAYTLWYENGNVVKWPSNGFTLNVNPWLAIFQPTAWDAMIEARDRWYEQPSYFGMSVQWDDEATQGHQNGESEFSFHTQNAYLCGAQADGCCYTYTDGNGAIVEADIYLRTSQTWTVSTAKTAHWAYGGAARLMQGVMVHELGHAAGLDHEDSYYNVMGVETTHLTTNGANAFTYVGEDASSGVRAAYGTWGATDVGVVHWKWDPATTGVYSSHMRTQVFNSSNVLLGWQWVANEPHYQVTKGSVVKVELNFENNGSTVQSALPVRWYLSTDSTITTADTLLASTTVYVSPDTTTTVRQNVTIPATLTSGVDYWLGAVADPTATLAEFNENNNASYVGIRVL